MVDFHTHILPGVDDGSASVDESLELLAMEARKRKQSQIAIVAKSF